ncbi:hypothetical protein A2160_01755 [Candidatus Beckwithbacteria bacterium RBG_13_42_9]|uniref:SpoVT-AbrB domain-containing protein n=1 Tax=Candidatus Beckwithbacteria bacterium RBG_13_42_9 TaxID=1797457 RepID=A0A1F5E848_9BACT|nr:MAG: hypothetical protein A2160_01755 [Candidatus Beckwithbacteria bacterium RBG_13_42_9]
MLQKIIKVGNSLAVTLPKYFVTERRLKAGDNVFVEADAKIDLLQVRTKANIFPSLTTEFKGWLDQVTNRYSSTIKELAKK